ncbi:MAG: hypothetical protein AVDCRST_MAG05-3305 [uncultured Rubrobacteraceae bacterium]|uniref:Uncharacterized protein n=1 Tax=uncultured Rubrobacteraceae bacterium TaxID=349277 RepID=A0A6J4T8A8_9ACTN|nr:MAG: hypothetical protein AVDCRST_MAG05-3305 [uncultured Rubrobacteraceae bacterium]
MLVRNGPRRARILALPPPVSIRGMWRVRAPAYCRRIISRASSSLRPPNSPSKTGPQNGHSRAGLPQPQSRFSMRACFQIKFSSPPEKKPSTCPRVLARIVLPLRPRPAT